MANGYTELDALLDGVEARNVAKYLGRYSRGVINYDPSQLSKARRALGDAFQGQGKCRIGWIDDSNGVPLAGGPGGTARKVNSPSAMVGKALGAAGYPINGETVFGSGRIQPLQSNYPTYNPKVSLAGTWSEGIASLGGPSFRNAATDKWTYTPTTEWDTAELWFPCGTTTLNITCDVGGTTTPFALSGATNGYRKITYSPGTSAVQTLNVARVSGGSNGVMDISGMILSKSTAPAVDIVNMAWSGSTSTNWAESSSPWSPPNAITQVGLDLAIIGLSGTNDAGILPAAGVTKAAYKANKATLIAAARPTIDLIGFTSRPLTALRTSLTPYEEADIELALEYNFPIIDTTYLLGNFTEANARGFINVDGIHILGNACAVQGAAAANLLLAA